MTLSNIYTSGEYTKKNHSYHIEDSVFKWSNFFRILKKSSLDLSNMNSVTEVGCGSGQILVEAKLSGLFNNECKFEGYDINPDAINLAKKNSKEINFFNEDFVGSSKNISDLVIAADVFEHVENSYNFLKELKKKSNFFLFNIPLEINLLSMVRKKNIFENSFEKVGHLHFYTKKTAILLLKSCGYEIIKYEYANIRFKEVKDKKSFKQFLVSIPQYLISIFNNNLACSIFGGYSLVVLAKKRIN